MVQQGPLISEKILLKFHHIICQIILSKGQFLAILQQGISILVIMKLNFKRTRERMRLNSPIRETLPTKLSIYHILMSIQQNHNIILVAHANNFLEFFNIGIIVDVLLFLNSFPGHMEADHVEAPPLQILQVHLGEGQVRGEVVQVRVEWKYFVHYIHPMVHSIPTVLVHEQAVVCVHPNLPIDAQQTGEK
jgi:hypothetical protein